MHREERSTLLAESLSRWRDRLDGVIAAVWLPRTHEDPMRMSCLVPSHPKLRRC